MKKRISLIFGLTVFLPAIACGDFFFAPDQYTEQPKKPSNDIPTTNDIPSGSASSTKTPAWVARGPNKNTARRLAQILGHLGSQKKAN